jgi:hypothetical protein
LAIRYAPSGGWKSELIRSQTSKIATTFIPQFDDFGGSKHWPIGDVGRATWQFGELHNVAAKAKGEIFVGGRSALIADFLI